jgi:hypothetical protein
MTINNDTDLRVAVQGKRLARPVPKAEDFAPFDFSKVDRSKNHRRGTPRKRKVRVHL